MTPKETNEPQLFAIELKVHALGDSAEEAAAHVRSVLNEAGLDYTMYPAKRTVRR